MNPFHRTAGLTAFAAFALWTLFCVAAYALVGFAGNLLTPSADPSGGVSDILGFLTGVGFFTVFVVWMVGSGVIAISWKMATKMLESSYGRQFQDRFDTMRDVTPPRRTWQQEPRDR
ncbi:hypothetical protein [Zavarzinia sp. CC-PAN008]|uniref:hypothetical protein n=1 Tax=Zavarzinia sp. CC-PAN008 TaxID=3243332 RepID=UPI003F7439C6